MVISHSGIFQYGKPQYVAFHPTVEIFPKLCQIVLQSPPSVRELSSSITLRTALRISFSPTALVQLDCITDLILYRVVHHRFDVDLKWHQLLIFPIQLLLLQFHNLLLTDNDFRFWKINHTLQIIDHLRLPVNQFYSLTKHFLGSPFSVDMSYFKCWATSFRVKLQRNQNKLQRLMVGAELIRGWGTARTLMKPSTSPSHDNPYTDHFSSHAFRLSLIPFMLH